MKSKFWSTLLSVLGRVDCMTMIQFMNSGRRPYSFPPNYFWGRSLVNPDPNIFGYVGLFGYIKK